MRLEHWLYTVPLRLRSFFRRRQVDQELDEEIRYHVEQKTQEYTAKGMTAQEARRAALREFGGVEQAKEKCRDMRKVNWIHDLLQDLRYGLRMLRKSTSFTLVAVLTLALGIGANTAIFSVVHAVLLKSLPYPDPGKLVVIDEYQVSAGRMSVSWANFVDWRAQSHTFQALAAYRLDRYALTGTGEPTLLRGAMVSAPFFSLLGEQPALGRTFTEGEDKPGAVRTAVLSYSFWRSRLGADPNVLGKVLTLDGQPYTVIGVMPTDARYFERAVDLYVPIGLEGNNPGMLYRGNHQGLRVLARLGLGASLAAGQNELETIERMLEQQYPTTNSGVRAKAVSLYEYSFGDVRPTLLALLAAVGCILLIACANVANLFLARATSRQREFAVRAALGAGRWRVVRQLLTESLLVSLFGGGLGLALSSWILDPLLRIAPTDIPRLAETRMDLGVFLFSFTMAVLTAVFFGLVPAFQASRVDFGGSLQGSARSATTGRGHHRLRTGLLVAEVAVAVVLVAASGLFIRSLLNAQGVNPGFQPDHLLALDVNLPTSNYKTAEERFRFFSQAIGQIRTLPGVVSAGAALCPPTVGMCWGSVYLLSDRPAPDQSHLPDSVFNVVDLQYFQTMRTPLIEGRYFNEMDTDKSSPVIIVNRSLARRWWPNESPLGKRIKQGFPEDKAPYPEIVGVVEDIQQQRPDEEQYTEVFLPIAQNPSDGMTLVVRTALDPMSLAAAAEREIHAIDKDQPVDRIQPMTQYLAESLARRKFSTLLLGIFAGLALLLAAVGVYGVMAYSVTQRTQEIGIRMALGAQPQDVLKMVVGYGLRLTLAGILIGIGAALGVTRLLASMLFGVGGRDPLTFLIVGALLFGVALSACYVPARRATRVDPLVALRHE